MTADLPCPTLEVAPLAAGRLSRRMRLHAPDVADHMARVRDLALRIADRAGLTGAQRRRIALAAGLHDIGKLGVPVALLEKPGPLTVQERARICRHSAIGARLLLADDSLAHVAGVVRAVHERWDGGGYPDGLLGDEIPVESRVIAVCDAWDAMTRWRPYRVPVPGPEALRELERGAGRQFDPRVVELMVDLVTGNWCVD